MCGKSIQLQHNQFVLRVGWDLGGARGVGAKGEWWGWAFWWNDAVRYDFVMMAISAL